jgi:hypothetical protein
VTSSGRGGRHENDFDAIELELGALWI